MSFACEALLGSEFSSSFNVWSEDVYSDLKRGLSNLDILLIIAFKFEWFLYFKISASIGFKRWKLKSFCFSLREVSIS